MCSRYSLTSPPEAVRAYFNLREVHDFPPRYNIAPTQPVSIVRNDLQGLPELYLVRWGLIPSWAKDPAKLSTLINARSETISEKPSFRGSLRHRRCLVPTDGYYEWTGKTGAKIPNLIRPRDGGLMAMAGLWEHWVGADGSEIETMAIVTMPAIQPIAHIHDRMPVILPPEHFAAWLDCRSGSAIEPLKLIRPPADDLLEAFTVSPRLNSHRHEGPDLIVPTPPPPAQPRLL